uniref:Reticulon n=1 Tax=Amphilophus citrinellus TaxID=61819 RepID=A0A3Q0SDC1_AMPCI
MDPVTQSAQISSSQGFADGHSSAAKESKLSDSFLSSSPVSLIQSPQGKCMVLLRCSPALSLCPLLSAVTSVINTSDPLPLAAVCARAVTLFSLILCSASFPPPSLRRALIDKDVSIPPETFRKHVDASLAYINRALKQMSRLFLVEDLVDSLKLAVVMWLLTYVGAVFNGITILILGNNETFLFPLQTQIDQYIDVVRTQMSEPAACFRRSAGCRGLTCSAFPPQVTGETPRSYEAQQN